MLLVWLFASGHCLLERIPHTHANQTHSTSDHHHHHEKGETNHDPEDSSKDSSPCEVSLALASPSYLTFKIGFSDLIVVNFLITKHSQQEVLFNNLILKPFERPDSESLSKTHLLTSIGPNSPPTII